MNITSKCRTINWRTEKKNTRPQRESHFSRHRGRTQYNPRPYNNPTQYNPGLDKQSCTIDISENPCESGARLLYNKLRSIQNYTWHNLYRENLVPSDLTGYESSIIIILYHNETKNLPYQTDYRLMYRLSVIGGRLL